MMACALVPALFSSAPTHTLARSRPAFLAISRAASASSRSSQLGEKEAGATDAPAKDLGHGYVFHAGEGEHHEERPVAVLLGWLLSKPQHLKKYSAWYNSQGLDTITLLPQPDHVLSTAKAEEAARHLLATLQSEPLKGRPVVAHGFSVGGYLFGHVLMQLQASELKSTFAKRLRAQIFDSPVDVEGVPQGMSVAMATNAMAQAFIKRSLETLLAARPQTLSIYRSSSRAFRDNGLGTPTHVFYSEADVVACPRAVESAMEGWRKKGVAVTHSLWDRSAHIQHMMHDQDRYFSDLHRFLSTHLPGHFTRRTHSHSHSHRHHLSGSKTHET